MGNRQQNRQQATGDREVRVQPALTALGRRARLAPVRAMGRHLLADLYECRHELLDDPVALEALAVEAVTRSHGTVVSRHHHHFEPSGVSVVIMVAESHLALHTWPEHRYVGVDYFTCGPSVEPRLAIELMRDALQPRRHRIREVQRGDELDP